MNKFVNRIFAFALVALSAGAGVAQAQQQASFYLPFPAQWGAMKLAPGNYSISVPELARSPRQFLVNGPETRGFILPMSTDISLDPYPSQKSRLQLVKVDGTFFVKSYQSGLTGTLFTFKAPSLKHSLEMASENVVNLATK